MKLENAITECTELTQEFHETITMSSSLEVVMWYNVKLIILLSKPSPEEYKWDITYDLFVQQVQRLQRLTRLRIQRIQNINEMLPTSVIDQ